MEEALMRITHGLKYPAALVASAGLLAGGYGVASAISPSSDSAAPPINPATSSQNTHPILSIEAPTQDGVTIAPERADGQPGLPAQPGDDIKPSKGGDVGQNPSLGMRPLSASIESLNLDDTDN